MCSLYHPTPGLHTGCWGASFRSLTLIAPRKRVKPKAVLHKPGQELYSYS
jgi:hypothetical protein